MNKRIRFVIALAVAGIAATAAQAQSAQKIMVVDIAKVYESHYKTAEQNALLQADQKKASEELQRRAKEIDGVVAELKDMEEQLQNPVTTDEAKKKIQEEGAKKLQDLQGKQREAQGMQSNLQRLFQERIGQFRALLLDEISKVAADVAKKKGATFLVDKSGPSVIGVPVFLYTDASVEITDAVIAEINASKPASSAAPAKAADGAPAITVPGSK
ncbi:MAG TPA: OmpH family outer membrane protein [Opitutaceae bacterium]|nr:MAG: Outer membrane protein (OmpH-like) [Verrucomicrobia bacterium ADurb.Bin122]HNW40362.1 OmpH family outer membrane protein [Opitutaceae bacterium]HOD46617.1 OmpH family outer membrane protein [Opitutaceae bacterium]HOG92440.1 OmpH family outer membrane protein [Opitutaceae bacterium]HOY53819.1 OmpH family outer membrane protein [Opitutaceae bacterium]